MKTNNDIKNNTKSKGQKKNSNKNIPFNSFFPIKYFCFNEVKKIVNGKNKNQSDIIIMKKTEKLKKEEEDNYSQSIYNQRLIKSRNLSGLNLIQNNLIINKAIEKKNFKKWNSTEERYKIVNHFDFYTKKIFHRNIFVNVKKSKFSKKNKKNKRFLKKKIKLNDHETFMIMQKINNTDLNNEMYKSNNINETNMTLNNNIIRNKTIINNTMNNFTLSNISANSNYNISNNINSYNIENKHYNVENESKVLIKKMSNEKNIDNKGRNKNNDIKNKNIKNNEKINTVFVRRIILEEKYIIDSKGEKKTIYIKKISPAIKTNEVINSADKRLFQNSNKIINKNKNYNNNDNTFINHNDINLNFNLCSFQKINLNGNNNSNIVNKNKLLALRQKMESFEEGNKININNKTSLNDILLQNYKNLLNVKNCNTIMYQKSNGKFKSDNHKSYQSLFQNPNKRYFVYLSGNNFNKKKSKINKKAVSNLNNNKIKNINNIQKSSIKELKNNNDPMEYLISSPRCLHSKIIHKKSKSNNISSYNKEYEKLKLNVNGEDFENYKKRSLSFCKSSIYDLIKNLKDNKKTNLKNENYNQIPFIPIKNKKNKIKEYFIVPSSNSGMSSKYKTKMNSVNNSKFIKLKKINKSKSYTNEINVNNQRFHPLNKIPNKNVCASNYIKCFFNYLKSIIPNTGRNKSHRNFLLKNCEQFDLDNLIIQSNKIHSNRMNYSNIIYNENETKKKIIKKKIKKTNLI